MERQTFVTAILALFTMTAFAQTDGGRIPAKGFAGRPIGLSIF